MTTGKLVRDRIPEIIIAAGGSPVTRVAGAVEYWVRLKEKLLEEVAEFIESENTEELADILEVLEAIREHQGLSIDDLMSVKNAKRDKRGGFAQRIILESP